MSWGTSLLAVLVGVLGVMNTMLMTVFERTQEICVLLALGWKRGRIMRMVLWESALLGPGWRHRRCAPRSHRGKGPWRDAGHSWVAGAGRQPESPGDVRRYCCWPSGILSGLYPAWRSSRLNPSRALQN